MVPLLLCFLFTSAVSNVQEKHDVVEQPSSENETWVPSAESKAVSEREFIFESSEICTKESSSKGCIRKDLSMKFSTTISDLSRYEVGNFTKDEMDTINSLGKDEQLVLGDVLFSVINPGEYIDNNGDRRLAVKCTGVLSATCDNYGKKNVDYQTYITHYPPNGGTPTNGWAEYTQLVYSLDFQELHRVWYKCQKTNLARKKKLYANHGLVTFSNANLQKQELWIKKQAICCSPQLCTFLDW